MKDETKEVKSQVAGTISTLMTVAFGLIAALAWNNAIQAIILAILPKGNGIMGLLIYAIVITIVAVLATFIIARALGKSPVQEVRIVE
jgi:putative flippase GtrA